MTHLASTLLQDNARPRIAHKRQDILEAAATLFLRDGYLVTSMDQVAAAAGVSKQTVYKQFIDKQTLFREIVTSTVTEVADPVAHQITSLRDSNDFETDLRDLAYQLLVKVIQPRVMQLRRLVIAEASRFPELGRLFYEHGPGHTIDTLAVVFKHLDSNGVLKVDDPNLAAEQFNWLIMSAPLNKIMFCDGAELPSATSLRHYAETGVRVFLAAYAKN